MTTKIPPHQPLRMPSPLGRADTRRARARSARALALAAALVAVLLPAAPAIADEVAATVVQEIDLFRLDPPSPDPAGIVWLPPSGSVPQRFVVVDCEVDELDIYDGANLWEIGLDGSLLRAGDTTGITREPTGVAYDAATSTMFLSDDNAREIYVLRAGADGRHGTVDDLVGSFDTARFGANDPEGVTFDTATGHLFIADGTGARIYRVNPGPNGFGGDDVVTSFSVSGFGGRDAEGIAYDAVRDLLVVFDSGAGALFETTKAGALVRTVDMSAGDVHGGGDVAVGPSSRDPSRRSYWVVSRGQNNESNPDENDGMLFELAVDLPASGNRAPVVTITTPPDGSSFAEGAAVTFTGTATDPEDGSISGSLSWASNLDGPLGTGATLIVADLPAGTHVVTASVLDSSGARGSASVSVVVSGGTGGAVPTGTILADATIVSASPGANAGSATSLEVDNSPVSHILFKLGVSGVGGRTVTSARLRLHNVNSSGSGGDFYGAAGTSWTEAGVTWNNAPAASGARLASLGSVSSGTWYEVELEGLVTGDGTFTVRVSSTSTNGADYASKERSGGLAPQLLLTVAGPPAPSLFFGDVAVDEGDSGQADATFTVSLNPAADSPVTVTATTAPGTATAAEDYVHNQQTLTFAPRQTVASFTVKVNGDTTPEPDEVFLVRLTGASGAAIGDGEGSGSVRNDDGTPPPPPGPPTGTILADATIVSASPGANAGSATSLEVDNSPVSHILFKLGVSGVGGRTVTSARLRLHNVNSSGSGGDFYGAAGTSWTEAGVTWNNAPAASGARLASLGSVSSGTWYEVELEGLVTGDGTFTVRVSSTSTNGADYASKERSGGLAPQLILTID